MTAEIGHNGGPTFDDTVRENIDRGLLLCMKETIVTAIKDVRLERRHLRVLAEVMNHLNSQSGVAYPSRKAIFEATREYDPADGVGPSFGYTEAGISKTLSELVDYGYLITVKRALERGGRALSLFTIRKPSNEELQEQITAWIMAQRAAAPSRKWKQVAPAVSTYVGEISPDTTCVGKVRRDSTLVGGVRSSDPTSVPQVKAPDATYVGNDTNVGRASPDSTSDSTYVDRTVTNTELGERRMDGRGGAQGGETHAGHGVFVNGETIRHAAFAISLPGIALATLNSGFTAAELKDRCLAHALQWAVEIEHGTRPDKVLPSKISNFLAGSIMGEANRARVTEVRLRKAAEPPATGRAFAGSQPAGATPAEPQTDRWQRKVPKLIGDQ